MPLTNYIVVVNYKYAAYIYIYKHIYIMDCVCQRYHKECSARTCVDDCLLKTSKLKSFVRPWFHGCKYNTNQIKKLYSSKYCYMLCSFLHTMSNRVAGKGVSNPKAEYIKSKDAYILSYYGFGFRWICAIDYRNFHITPYDTQINNAAFVAFEKIYIMIWLYLNRSILMLSPGKAISSQKNK